MSDPTLMNVDVINILPPVVGHIFFGFRIMRDACLLYVPRVLLDPSDTYHCVDDYSSRDPRA